MILLESALRNSLWSSGAPSEARRDGDEPHDSSPTLADDKCVRTEAMGSSNHLHSDGGSCDSLRRLGVGLLKPTPAQALLLLLLTSL